jgi:low temperature requirement protein LtrA
MRTALHAETSVYTRQCVHRSSWGVYLQEFFPIYYTSVSSCYIYLGNYCSSHLAKLQYIHVPLNYSIIILAASDYVMQHDCHDICVAFLEQVA